MHHASTFSPGVDGGVIDSITVAIAIFEVIAMWCVFSKAGRPGWAAIIPFYNLYVLIKIAARPGWWLVLFIVPVVNLVVSIIVCIDTAKLFGKSTAFGIIGLWLFGLVGYPILGFGSAQYSGPTGRAAESHS